MKKTLIKFVTVFVIATLMLSFAFIFLPFLLLVWLAFAFTFFALYYYNKNAFSYYITDKSVRVVKSWIFGNYVREITFDQIKDVHVMQGFLARIYNCGSLVFVTTSGLEVGYVGGGGAVGGDVIVGAGGLSPIIVKGRGNMFWDITDPGKAKEILIGKLTEWREAFQQQKISASLEKMAERTQILQPAPPETIVEKLEKLKKLLDEGAITKEEYEKAKRKLLG
jgi:hypothetical protein